MNYLEFFPTVFVARKIDLWVGIHFYLLSEIMNAAGVKERTLRMAFFAASACVFLKFFEESYEKIIKKFPQLKFGAASKYFSIFLFTLFPAYFYLPFFVPDRIVSDDGKTELAVDAGQYAIKNYFDPAIKIRSSRLVSIGKQNNQNIYELYLDIEFHGPTDKEMQINSSRLTLFDPSLKKKEPIKLQKSIRDKLFIVPKNQIVVVNHTAIKVPASSLLVSPDFEYEVRLINYKPLKAKVHIGSIEDGLKTPNP